MNKTGAIRAAKGMPNSVGLTPKTPMTDEDREKVHNTPITPFTAFRMFRRVEEPKQPRRKVNGVALVCQRCGKSFLGSQAFMAHTNMRDEDGVCPSPRQLRQAGWRKNDAGAWEAPPEAEGIRAS